MFARGLVCSPRPSLHCTTDWEEEEGGVGKKRLVRDSSCPVGCEHEDIYDPAKTHKVSKRVEMMTDFTSCSFVSLITPPPQPPHPPHPDSCCSQAAEGQRPIKKQLNRKIDPPVSRVHLKSWTWSLKEPSRQRQK